MRSAERGQEVVERHPIREIDHGQLRTPLALITMEEIVISDGEVE